MTSKIVKVIKAQVGETVEIQWRTLSGEVYAERHTAPPSATLEARLNPTRIEAFPSGNKT